MSRRYHSPLREQRMAETREKILLALADVIAEEGVSDLAVQDVADRAGVSHRTVYRHFADRQGLLDALAEWVQEGLGAEVGATEDEIAGLDHALATIPRVFAGFDELGTLAVGMARLSLATEVRSALHRERTERFRGLFAPHLEGLEDPEAVFAVIRHLMSAVTWWVLRDEFGLEGERAGRAVATVVQAVLAAAEDEPSGR